MIQFSRVRRACAAPLVVAVLLAAAQESTISPHPFGRDYHSKYVPLERAPVADEPVWLGFLTEPLSFASMYVSGVADSHAMSALCRDGIRRIEDSTSSRLWPSKARSKTLKYGHSITLSLATVLAKES